MAEEASRGLQRRHREGGRGGIERVAEEASRG